MPRDTKKPDIGDVLLPWDDLEKWDEFYRRVEEARKEVKAKGRIVFYVDKSYRYHHKKRPSFIYKQTITGFRPIAQGGMPRYKDHRVSFIVVRTADGRELSRCITSNAEEVAFLDMKDGIVREENRELTPFEKMALEKQIAESRLAEIEAKLKERGDQSAPEQEEKKQVGRPKGKKEDTPGDREKPKSIAPDETTE